MSRVEWNGDKLPGERGRKVEAWRARSRYKVAAILGIWTAIMFAANGWLARGDPRRRPAMWWAMAAVMLTVSILNWIVGARRAARHKVRRIS
jgi:hypothetical protein